MKTLLSIVLSASCAFFVLSAKIDPAYADTFHYACHDGDELHYSLVIDTGKRVVKMTEYSPNGRVAMLRILNNHPSICDKGWSLTNETSFCYSAQGSGYLHWNGGDGSTADTPCNQAD
jgi:hypothetical protein